MSQIASKEMWETVVLLRCYLRSCIIVSVLDLLLSLSNVDGPKGV